MNSHWRGAAHDRPSRLRSRRRASLCGGCRVREIVPDDFANTSRFLLLLLSAATRLYTAKAQSHEERESWVAAIAGVTLVLVPILVLCAATIYTLRSDVARQAFGG